MTLHLLGDPTDDAGGEEAKEDEDVRDDDVKEDEWGMLLGGVGINGETVPSRISQSSLSAGKLGDVGECEGAC
jgi:hypothetical protein